MSSQRSSGSGSGGRGALLRQLRDLEVHENTSIPNQGVLTHDSGVGFSGSPSLSAPRATGRGRLLELLSSGSESSNESPKPRGRAQLLSSLNPLSSDPKTSNSNVTSKVEPTIDLTEVKKSLANIERSQEDDGHFGSTDISNETPKPRGRAQLFSSLKSLSSDPKTSNVVSKVEPTKNVTEVKKSLAGGEYSQVESSQKKDLEPVIKRGTKGTPVRACCNYIRLRSDGKKGVFEYEVKFVPNVDSRNMRIKHLNEHRSKFGGTRTFDGVTLYLPILLPDTVTYYNSTNPANNTNIEIKIIYKRKKPLQDCMHLYNVLFDRIMKTLNYVRFDRKQYDPTKPKIIPQHKLEVWPGYVTAVDEYEDGIMLCCDTSHRILCQTTVLQTLAEAYRASPTEFQENAKKALLGSIVLTRYNNKTYRIDDIEFTLNPLSTFDAGGKQISFVEYYKNQYGINIIDLKQPLLKSIKKRRDGNSETPTELQFSLVPEICYLTGLRDSMRSDTIVMRDIATFTRITPNQRMQALHKFYTNINNSKEASEILGNWGLQLENQVEHLVGRQLDEEMVIFSRKQYSAGPNADFGRYATNNELLDVVNVSNWLLIYTRNDLNAAKSFLDCFERNSRPMGIQVSSPQVQILQNDRTDTYVTCLRENIKQNTQIVVIICPTSRDDRYAAIKKVCCTEIPIPSQVINARTLRDPNKNRSIVQKIALQMNCKLGGSLWSIKIPFKNVMICGIDSYHEAANRGNSVSAFVASLNDTYTKWYSRAIIQTRSEEIVNGLCVSLKYALQAYEKRNGYLPEKIIIYRDGVGDGNLKLCSEYEIPQLQQACKIGNTDYNPLFTYVVVQKRINTRLFMESGNDLKNPNPGFVLDHTITRKYLYDFFLVAQAVRQGTVTPSHYIVVYDSADTNPDIVQRLSYKLCFLYYNWPGTVRVPACCQYAHKLAYLVGQSIKRPTSELLSTKLFYL